MLVISFNQINPNPQIHQDQTNVSCFNVSTSMVIKPHLHPHLQQTHTMPIILIMHQTQNSLMTIRIWLSQFFLGIFNTSITCNQIALSYIVIIMTRKPEKNPDINTKSLKPKKGRKCEDRTNPNILPSELRSFYVKLVKSLHYTHRWRQKERY